MSDNTSPDWGFETRMIHSGQRPDAETSARAVPIYQTTSYVFNSAEHAQNLFALTEIGNIYTRIMNPTQHVLEERVNALEGGVRTAVGLPGTLALSSGQAAETLALLNLAESGDHIVASPSLYGGTYNLLHYTMPKMGIETTFVNDPDDLDEWADAVKSNTRVFYAETIGNPKNDVLDFEGVSGVAHANGVPLMVDNTVPTPYLCQPFQHGADIVVHSATKFLGGHGNSIGGLIVDGGTFDFGAAGRHKMLTDPDPSYHGLPYWPALGHGAYIIKARVQLLRDVGAAVSPMNAFLFLQGIETLSLRMERHVSNSIAVAQYLEAHPQVEWVQYAGLESSPYYERAKRYLPKGAGSVMAFGVDGGSKAGQRFVESLQLHSHVANIGDVRSLAIHPASTTHSQLTPEEQISTGTAPNMVRLSVGIESVDDIIADLDVGFASIRQL